MKLCEICGQPLGLLRSIGFLRPSHSQCYGKIRAEKREKSLRALRTIEAEERKRAQESKENPELGEIKSKSEEILARDALRYTEQVLSFAFREGYALSDTLRLAAPILKAKKIWIDDFTIMSEKTKRRHKVRAMEEVFAPIHDASFSILHSVQRLHQIDRVVKHRPYGRYVCPLAEEEPFHARFNGIVLLLSSPWWKHYTPPNGWSCKCYFQSLSSDDIARYNFKVSQKTPMPGKLRTLSDPRSSKMVELPEEFDLGFFCLPSDDMAREVLSIWLANPWEPAINIARLRGEGEPEWLDRIPKRSV
jgi:hypothetical protein